MMITRADHQSWCQSVRCSRAAGAAEAHRVASPTAAVDRRVVVDGGTVAGTTASSHRTWWPRSTKADRPWRRSTRAVRAKAPGDGLSAASAADIPQARGHRRTVRRRRGTGRPAVR